MEYKLHPGSSDNYFIRLKNGFIFNTYDIKSKKIFLSCKLRGKGKLNFYVFRYSAKNRFLGSKFMKTFDAKPGPQWKDHSFIFDRPGEQSESQCLVVWPAKGAEIDIDDVILMPRE